MSIRDALNRASTAPPFAGFVLTGLDDASDPSYFGYTSINGAWVIKRLTSSTGVMEYSAGASGYSTAWADRQNLTYTSPDYNQ